MKGAQRMEPGSAQWCPVAGPNWAQTGTQEVPSEHQETVSHCEGGRALAQVAQGGCGVSILGGIQKPSGHLTVGGTTPAVPSNLNPSVIL